MANLSRRFPNGTPALQRFFSTAALQQKDPLYRRLSNLGRTSGMVASTIDAYTSEGRNLSLPELETCIRDFRRFKRFHLALEIMEWMEIRKFNFNQRDYAVCVDLIAKVKGIAAAENYFNSLPPTARAHSSYGALLNCYCNKKMAEKALDLFAKMDKENMLATSLPFNNLMSLHLALGQPEKVLILGQEMKKRRIWPSKFTYNLLMNSYAQLNDIKGAERVFEEMKRDTGKKCDWTSYGNLASIYIKAGYREKAKLALQNVEKEMGSHDCEAAYHFLISLYASLSDLDQVCCVWKSLKSTRRIITNRSYLIMLQALGNMGDIKGMTRFYKNWESVCSIYDIRLANAAIRAYLRHGMPEKAESVLEVAIRRSRGPFFYAWEQFMIFYLNKNQIKRALQIMETAALEAHKMEWEPSFDTVGKFLDYFKKESDVRTAEEFYKLMKKINCVDRRLYESLLETYKAAGETVSDMRTRLEGDGVEVSSEMEHLLASVCPE